MDRQMDRWHEKKGIVSNKWIYWPPGDKSKEAPARGNPEFGSS